MHRLISFECIGCHITPMLTHMIQLSPGDTNAMNSNTNNDITKNLLLAFKNFRAMFSFCLVQVCIRLKVQVVENPFTIIIMFN